mgnify:CR=1 FL=1
MKRGLVLEGGGMRGIYTIGVLDLFDEYGIWFDYVIGVSAGACNGASFVSGQRGRSLRINTGYLRDKRYLGLQSFVKTKSLFGMDFIFREIPDRLDPFDYKAFHAAPCEFVVGVTDVQTGGTVYFGKESMQGQCDVLRASSSIPVFSPPVAIQGREYLDGGTTDAIPVRKALADGCDSLVVVLTRQRGYQKRPEGMRSIYRRVLKGYPAVIEALDHRHEGYNETLRYLETLEQEKKALVLAPREAPLVGRFEKKREKLLALYQMGREDAFAALDQLPEYSCRRT